MNERRFFNREVMLHYSDLAGIPRSRDDVKESLRRRLRRRCEHQVEKAITYLAAAGYIEDCAETAADDPIYRITAGGIRQAEKQVPRDDLDMMIWGAQ